MVVELECSLLLVLAVAAIVLLVNTQASDMRHRVINVLLGCILPLDHHHVHNVLLAPIHQWDLAAVHYALGAPFPILLHRHVRNVLLVCIPLLGHHRALNAAKAPTHHHHHHRVLRVLPVLHLHTLVQHLLLRARCVALVRLLLLGLVCVAAVTQEHGQQWVLAVVICAMLEHMPLLAVVLLLMCACYAHRAKHHRLGHMDVLRVAPALL